MMKNNGDVHELIVVRPLFVLVRLLFVACCDDGSLSSIHPLFALAYLLFVLTFSPCDSSSAPLVLNTIRGRKSVCVVEHQQVFTLKKSVFCLSRKAIWKEAPFLQ